MINELLSLVTCGFDIPRESESAVTGDTRIRQPTQPVGTQKLLSRAKRGFDSPHTSLGSQKVLSRVTRGFYSPHSPLGTLK
jgi:hypothetical protein